MDKLLFRTLLLDFYGELLTDRQRKAFSLLYQGDLSLNEAAAELGVSAQAVWDLASRTEKTLRRYEEKLRLIEKHMKRKAAYEELMRAPGCPEGIKTLAANIFDGE